MPSKNKAKSSTSLSPHSLDTDTLASLAESELAKHRYKEATELFKELLKRERRENWVEGLAASYSGRAHSLADKSMFKEALVLWRNRQQICGKPLIESPYLTWLLRAGEQNEALRLLNDPNLADAERTVLETHLASVVLSWPDMTPLPELPKESLLLCHRPAALNALRACLQGNIVEMNEQLATIPFRSPYRDMKPLLKALALISTDRVAAAEAVTRLPVNGPFEHLAIALRLAVQPGLNWMMGLHAQNGDVRQLVLDLRGCPDALRPLLLDFARLGERPNPETFFDLVLRHRRQLPEGLAKQTCYQLLPYSKRRLNVFIDTFGPISAAYESHIHALSAEAHNNQDLAFAYWIEMVNALVSPAHQTATNKLRAALILRKISSVEKLTPEAIGSLPDKGFSLIVRSNELDPDDLKMQIIVIAGYRYKGDLKSARACLDLALKRFPKESALLQEAVQIAIAGDAFKKAVGYAKQVLELDPINPTVRRLIGHAHLSHARKQIKAKKTESAFNELDAAVEWLRSGEDLATLDLLRGIAGNDATADQRLSQAVAHYGDTLLGAFYLAMEADIIKIPVKTLLKRANIVIKNAAELNAVVALAHAIKNVRQQFSASNPNIDKTIASALSILSPMLRPAATNRRFSEDDMRLICETFLQVKDEHHLHVYAKSALARWPKHPLFVYYKAEATRNEMPPALYNDLIAAREACKQTDRQTLQRIDGLLMALESEFNFFNDNFFGSEDDSEWMDEEDMDNPLSSLNVLLAIGGEQLLFKYAREVLGEPTYILLKKQIGGSDAQFAQALIHILGETVSNKKMR
jgi:cellulose synthase operon protein C